jgi:hypothetical protein
MRQNSNPTWKATNADKSPRGHEQHRRRLCAGSHQTKNAMTDETAPEIYPQYCFHLSPTISHWCHLQATDILALKSHPGFEGGSAVASMSWLWHRGL